MAAPGGGSVFPRFRADLDKLSTKRARDCRESSVCSSKRLRTWKMRSEKCVRDFSESLSSQKTLKNRQLQKIYARAILGPKWRPAAQTRGSSGEKSLRAEVHSVIHSFIQPVIHSVSQSFIHSVVSASIQSFCQPVSLSISQLLIHSAFE